MNLIRLAFVACVLYTSSAAAQQTEPELAELRAMLDALRDDYQQRIAELEARVAAAEERAAAAEEAAEDLAYAPQPTTTTSASAFNPGIGVVLSATYAATDLSEDDYAIPGFLLGPETGPVADGLSLGESELNFNASIDDKFLGNLTFALADHEGELEVELEEAWLQTTALPAGLQLTAGRFFSGIGYLNQFHRHADDFIDRPLPYQAFLAGQYLDDGVQVRWLAPTANYVELGAELLRGGQYPAAGAVDGAGAWSVFARTGGDIGLSHSWQAGIFHLDADVDGRSGGEDHGHEAKDEDDHEESLVEAFFGTSELTGLEWVYKWAPDGNSAVRNLQLQGEYFRRDESGLFGEANYRGDQDGWYVQGVYQFRPGWRFGLRHEALNASNEGVAGTPLDDLGFDPQRSSVMLEWFNSEYSRVLLQYSRDESSLFDDDVFQLRYITSFGAHRAHQF